MSTSFIQSSLSSSFLQLSTWLGPACAPLLWFLLGLVAIRLSRNDTVTTVNFIDSKMKRSDRRANEKHRKRSLKQQIKKFRATSHFPSRVHGKFIRRRRNAPTCAYRQQRSTYDRIYDEAHVNNRACSNRHKRSARLRRNSR